MKPLLHFAHANGIPSATYVSLFADLSTSFDVIDVPLIGTDSHYPVTNHWPHLVQQVIDSIERQANGRQVIGVGHSLGGALTLMAARKRPALFSQVIMLDPPLIMGMPSLMLYMSKFLGNRIVDKLSPSGLSLKRRDHWDSREQAAASLRHKGLFKTFVQADFDAYIAHGLTEDLERGGVTLTIPKMTEVEIFRTNPSYWWLPQRPMQVKTNLIVGADSEFLRYKLPQRIKAKLGIPFTVIEGGHMFPLEYPEATAQAVLDLITTSGMRH